MARRCALVVAWWRVETAKTWNINTEKCGERPEGTEGAWWRSSHDDEYARKVRSAKRSEIFEVVRFLARKAFRIIV